MGATTPKEENQLNQAASENPTALVDVVLSSRRRFDEEDPTLIIIRVFEGLRREDI